MNTVRLAALSGGLDPRSSAAEVVTDGKFLRAGDDRFRIKGVTYGTFAPDAAGCQFPAALRVAADFRQMAALGINTIRTYTMPPPSLLDEAARQGLRVLAGIPWSQHVAFLEDDRSARAIRRDIVAQVAAMQSHPAIAMFALGSEIPAGVVRWHGRRRIERFLRGLYEDAKAAAPDKLFTYANFPPTEFLDLGFFDVCAFNVYLHREADLRAYLARLQNVAGDRPLLLAEAGADSLREGTEGQAAITARHIRVAFEEGACGAIAFAWTDEWWRGGHPIEDWAFGLVDRNRQPKPAAAAVAAAFDAAPFSEETRRTWPRVSVVVCAYNAAHTLDDCLTSLARLDYPDYEVLLVNDGSHDETGAIGRRHPHVRVIDVRNGGLSVARNIGLAEAAGEIVAYTDADVRVDREWLTYLVQPFLHSDVVGCGGPNVVPHDDPPTAQCVARSPGAPTHVLFDDRIAEHVPGCNMAFRRDALLAIGGFNPIYVRAGDDVDVCWRLQARGWRIGFAASALVWHHHRGSVRAYWRQQSGYGEGEAWLKAHHPERFLDGWMRWHGRIYSPLPFVRSLSGRRVNAGVWGTASFPSVYQTTARWWVHLPHSIVWQVCAAVLLLAGVPLWVNGAVAGAVMSVVGAAMAAVTLAANASYALRTSVDGVPRSRSTAWYRWAIFLLHLLQPLARSTGRVRGWLSPRDAEITSGVDRAHLPVHWSDVARGLRLMLLASEERRYWSEQWIAHEELLGQLRDSLRQSRAIRAIVVDDGWSEDHDLSAYVGRCAWLDIRALLEDHGAGRGLLRIRLRLRPTRMGALVATALALVVSVLSFMTADTGHLDWPLAGGIAAVLVLAVQRVVFASAAVRQRIDRVAATAGLSHIATSERSQAAA